jgi:hypothetical protein
MPCKGCAAKVGPTTLRQMLQTLSSEGRGAAVADGYVDVSSMLRPGGIKMEDAAVMPPVPEGRVQVQTVDFINACTGDLYIFARIAAIHALADCYAVGATPSIALVTAQVCACPSFYRLPVLVPEIFGLAVFWLGCCFSLLGRACDSQLHAPVAASFAPLLSIAGCTSSTAHHPG